LALLLAGAMAAVVGLAVAAALRQDACLDAGGRWLARGGCEIDGGTLPGAGGAYMAGALAGLVVLAVAWRAYTLVTTRASRPAR
jgi:hypothetical protein